MGEARLIDTADEVTALATGELTSIADSVVRDALRARLVLPQRHLRNWDYGPEGQQFPCWTIALDHVSDTAIVYSQYGFGPDSPWGLVSISDLWFGMDAGWFLRLEDAFVESYLASDLPIWNVVQQDDGLTTEVVASSLTMDDAFRRRDAVQATKAEGVFHVVYRSAAAAGVP
jgi:hypothetical protein